MPKSFSCLIRLARTGLCAALTATAFISGAFAGSADISNVPLSATTTRPKPNIMLILDDSGSMASEYMPDDMYWPGYFGYFAAQCNGLAFNPNQEYPPPIKADGTSYPNSSFSSAPDDGYNSSSSTSNTSNLGDENGIVGVTADRRGYYYKYGYRHYYTYTGTQTATNWTYATSGSVDTSTTFYKECNSWIDSTLGTSTPGSGVFTQRRIKDQSSAIQQKYANWHSYYRTRLNLMRTATGHAFANLDSNYRVGFTMISDSGVTGDNFLNVADYTSAQKTSFYNKLYNSYSGSWTPLRASLSKVGRYFGNSISGQTDPMQYSCQRNFALLSTDGYWNSQIEGDGYRPYKLDGSTLVGQQDGSENRPMKDSATNATVMRKQTVTSVTSVFSQSQNSAASSQGTGGCSSTRYLVTQQLQTCTVSWTKTTVFDEVTSNGVTTIESVSETAAPTSCSPYANSGSATTSCYGNRSLGNLNLSPGGTSTTTNATTETNGASNTTNVGAQDDRPSGGASNSLADVAQYYWATDLRTGTGWANTLSATANDSATHQHLNTYTVGLGVRGSIAYDRNYLTQTSGDFVDIKNGTKNWPVPIGTTSDGSANATHIDDLWHAAVNGRGQYFSATDSQSLSDAISTMLTRVKEETGAGAAAAASTLTPVTGDDWIFLPSYTSVSWYGDVRAFQFTFSNGKAVPPSDTSDGKEAWSARKKLDARNLSTSDRTILFKGSASTLVEFTYSNLSTASLNSHFDNRCTTASDLLSQCASLDPTPKAKVTGTNLVAFLRGDRSLEMNAVASDDQVFRSRSSRLGDFANASPVYVGKPPFKYSDSGYASFSSTNASRTKVVYAGGNDGMLHAFKVGTDSSDASGGTELWAYIPRAMLPHLWRLASNDYADNHRYYVDATPVAADVYDSANSRWRTVLIGGFGAGGRGYYALDITTPESPTVLWEINADGGDSDFQHIGLTYGTPIVTKNNAGTWLAVFTSGTNNISGTGGIATGDGVGRLFVVNAMTGAKVDVISTGAGSTTTPSNLNRVEAWVEAETNNTALRLYGGDMLGNLWRFDHDNLIAPSGKEAFKLGTAKYSSTAQPITTKPLLSVYNGSTPLIAFGTGRYLGITDLTDTSAQSIYVVKDALDTTSLGDLQTSGAKLVQQTLNSSRTLSSAASVDFATQNGWYINLTADGTNGERVNIDPIALSTGTLAFATTKPSSDLCTPGGTSYLYLLSLGTGTVASVTTYTKVIVGMSTIVNTDGTRDALMTFNNQTFGIGSTSGSGGGSLGSLKRVTWRELLD